MSLLLMRNLLATEEETRSGIHEGGFQVIPTARVTFFGLLLMRNLLATEEETRSRIHEGGFQVIPTVRVTFFARGNH